MHKLTGSVQSMPTKHMVREGNTWFSELEQIEERRPKRDENNPQLQKQESKTCKSSKKILKRGDSNKREKENGYTIIIICLTSKSLTWALQSQSYN